MADETTSSTLSELYTEIVAEALFVAQEASVLRNLVTNYNITGQGKTISVPIYAAVSAAAVNEATDLANTEVNPTEATFTASEHGVMTTLTDLGASSASRNVAADIGKLFGEAIAKKIDVDLTALFDGFSQEVGDGTAVLSAANVFNAVAVLRKTAVPTSEISGVVLPSKRAFALAAKMRYILARGPAPHSSQSLAGLIWLSPSVRVLLTKSTAYSITLSATGTLRTKFWYSNRSSDDNTGITSSSPILVVDFTISTSSSFEG